MSIEKISAKKFAELRKKLQLSKPEICIICDVCNRTVERWIKSGIPKSMFELIEAKKK